MGRDSVQPFLEFHEKWAIVLGLTSNAGSADFQMLPLKNEKLYENVMRTAASWGSPDNMMFVVGATQASAVADIRKILPDSFFLVPGVGAQGGSLKDISEKGMNKEVGLLVNASRAVIYAEMTKNLRTMPAPPRNSCRKKWRDTCNKKTFDIGALCLAGRFFIWQEKNVIYRTSAQVGHAHGPRPDLRQL